MREPLISVIVPVYRVEEYLNRCVESIVRQTYQALEIILVDDGSPDRCPEMCDKWAKKDSRIRVVHKENGGLSDARNAGLAIASGEYVSFIDSDDWVELNIIEKMAETLFGTQADICACGIRNCYPDCETVKSSPYLCGRSTAFLGLLYDNAKYPVCAWAKLYKRKLWENIRFPIGKLHEDAFVTYRLLDAANLIVQIPDVLYCYRIREGSIMRSSFSHRRMDEEEAWRSNLRFIEQHYPEHKKAAFAFYIQKVNVIWQSIQKDLRAEYREDWLRLRKILKENMIRFLFCMQTPLKQRLRILYDFIRT